jgi:organic radical activating enzyme
MYASYTSEASKLHNIKTHTIEQALNSPGLKEMRKSMIENKPHGLCAVCNHRTDNNIHSTRDYYNNLYLDRTVDLINKTNEDGSIDIENFNPIYVDLRFSNLCNLKCRMCSLQASSAWYNETVEYNFLTGGGPIYYDKKFENNGGAEKVQHLLNNVESMYWAGGEPLILDEHYKILDYLIDTDRAKDVSLSYNTNLTVYTYKNKPIIDYWKHFKHVSVIGSMDGMEDVCNYIRTGTTWKKAQEVFNIFNNSGYAHIDVNPCITLSILNILHVPEFIQWCFENNWFPRDIPEITLNFVDYPEEMSIKYLPDWAKLLAKERILTLMSWLVNNQHPRSAMPLSNIIKYLDSDHSSQSEIDIQLSKLKLRLDTYDITAKLDWKSSLPEVNQILRTY